MLGRQFVVGDRVQHDRADSVVAQLFDARFVGEVPHPASQVVDLRHVERAVADRDLVEAVRREVLPDAVERAVGRQVEDRAWQADLGARRLRHERVAEMPGAFADDADHEHDTDGGARRHGRQPHARAAEQLAEPAGKQLRAGAGEQREEQRRQREDPSRHAHAVPSGRVVVQQPVGISGASQAHAAGEDRADDHADEQADAQSSCVDRRGEADQREQQDQTAGEEDVLVLGVHVFARAGGHAAPDAVLR